MEKELTELEKRFVELGAKRTPDEIVKKKLNLSDEQINEMQEDEGLIEEVIKLKTIDGIYYETHPVQKNKMVFTLSTADKNGKVTNFGRQQTYRPRMSGEGWLIMSLKFIIRQLNEQLIRHKINKNHKECDKSVCDICENGIDYRCFSMITDLLEKTAFGDEKGQTHIEWEKIEKDNKIEEEPEQITEEKPEPYAMLNILMDKLSDFSYAAIRKYVMENDYYQELKEILPEVEFIKSEVDEKNNLFKVKMKHQLFINKNKDGVILDYFILH